MAKRLSAEEWETIRRIWEYDPDEPGSQEAAARAAKKNGFNEPTRQAVAYRIRKEEWERKGSMSGIVEAAQRKADNIAKRVEGLAHAQASRVESEDQRADVIARHREEWRDIIQLRDEARAVRDEDVSDAFNRSKLAKIHAEILTLQQSGERKAWGLDEAQVPDLKNKTDAELKAIIAGKAAV